MKRPGLLLPSMLAVMGLQTPLASAAVIHGPVINPANGHLYYLLSQQNWTASENEAISLGGHLATVSNQAENDWINQTFSQFDGQARYLWLGLNDRATEGEWVWVSGETSPYRHWAPGEPNNLSGEDCAHILPDAGGMWNDRPCNIASGMGGVVEVISSVSISSFTVSPNSGSSPLTVVFNCRATTKKVGADLEYHWDVNGDGVIDQTTNTGRLEYTYPANGLYDANVTVDDDPENDLKAIPAKSLKVTVADGPELMGKIESYQFDDTLNSVTIKLRVSNTGNQAAGAFRVSFSVSDAGKASTIFKSSSIAGVAKGANTLVTVSHTFPESIYGRQIDVQVDSARKIKEVNETNNGSQIIIRPK